MYELALNNHLIFYFRKCKRPKLLHDKHKTKHLALYIVVCRRPPTPIKQFIFYSHLLTVKGQHIITLCNLMLNHITPKPPTFIFSCIMCNVYKNIEYTLSLYIIYMVGVCTMYMYIIFR